MTQPSEMSYAEDQRLWKLMQETELGKQNSVKL
jgi:hypothetical protein